MILWLSGSLFLLHSAWRVYRSGDVLAAFACLIGYFAVAMGMRRLLPFMFWQPLYYPLFFPYAVLAVSAMVWLALRAMRGRHLMPDDMRLKAMFASILALHAGLLVCGVWKGWGGVLLAYGTLPPLICCTAYLLYRFLLKLEGVSDGKWPWVNVGLLGFAGALFILTSSEVLLPVIDVLWTVLGRVPAE